MEEEEHEVYGGEIPVEGEMEGDVDMSVADDDAVKELDEMKKRLKEMEEEAAALREMQAKVEKEMGAVQDPAGTSASQAGKEETDSRSVFVGNACALEAGTVKCGITLSMMGQLQYARGQLKCLRGSRGKSRHAILVAGLVSARSVVVCVSQMNHKGEGEGVDYACTPEEVQQHFQSCGTVNRVTILTDKFGQPKGFAYVEFLEAEAVQEALVLNESELHGRQLKVLPKRTNVPGMKQYRPRRYNPYMGFRRPYVPPYFYSPYGYGKMPRFRRSMRYMPYH